MSQPIGPTNIEASLGDVSGQVAIGDYNVQIHAEHGAVVNFSGPEKQVRPSRRLSPQRLRPRPFYDLLDRKTEIESVISAVAAATPVQFYGPPGAGKTTLLRYLAYRAEVERLSDGVVYLSALNQPPEDLLQSLFDAFYECGQAFKPTDAQLRHYFANTQAAILLDDLDLTREQTGLLLNVAPECAFVLVSPVQSLWGEGRALALPGLPAADGLALIERELGRALSLEERDAAQTINSALDGQPLRIIRLVASAIEERRSLVEAASSLQIESRDARVVPIAGEIEAKSVESLPDGERRVLSVVAAFGNEPVRAQHVSALTGNSAIHTTLDSLVRRGLLQSTDDRYSLAGGLTETISRLWDLASFRSSALAYFTTWAEEHREVRDELMKDIGAITRLMKWGVAAGRWEEVRRLGRAVEGALAVSGRWGAWARTLEHVLRGSEATANKAGIAWAMHQLGTRALCLSDKSTARSYLTQALDMRRSMGDQSGASVTQHNLDLLLGPPTDQRQRDSREQRDAPKRWRLTKRFLVPAVVALLGAFGIWSALPAPVPVVSPERVEFSEQVVSERSEPRTVTLSNPHWRSAGISNVAIEGDNAEDFAITENNCATSVIGARSECMIRVAFVPSGIGGRAARLVIAAGAKGQSLTTVQLTGIGVMPPPSDVTVAPNTLSFLNQEIGVESEAQSVIIKNKGLRPFELGQVSLSGAGAAFFKITTNCDRSVIAPGETCTIGVTFAHTAPGSQSATLIIPDASGKPLHDSVVVTGATTGVPYIDTRPPDAVDFETLEIGSQSTPHQIEIINKGTAPLRISDIVIADGHTGEFSVNVKNCARATLQPGEACAIAVQFNPKTFGSHSASLRIEDRPNHLSQIVLLRGAATAARIRVDPTALDFGSHQVGEKLGSRTLTVSNLGDAQLRIDSIAKSGGEAAAFLLKTDCNGAVSSNGCHIGVSFLTTSAGKFAASIIISSNAVNGIQTILLNGEVTPQPRPEVKLSGNALDFGPVEVGKSSKKQKITVYNVGQAPLKIDGIRWSAGDADDFSSTTKCDKSPVAQNSNCTVEIGFSPKAPGSRSAILLISDNTPNGAESIKVSGLGASVDGWCCAGEKVYQTSASECQKQKGAFKKTEALAKLACRKIGVCCIDGEQSGLSESECRDRGGIFYSNPLEAVLKCKKKAPENGWCCVHGEVFSTPNQQACQNNKGTFFKTKSEAKRQCKTGGNPVGAIQ